MADSRLAFDIIARGGTSAAAEFEKVARGADRAGDSMKKNQKISADAAKASAALTKAHNAETTALDKVQVAEARLADVRNNSKAKSSQVLAAEKSLAKARRDAAVAGNVAQKAAKDLTQALDDEGKKAGKGLGSSMKKWFTGDGKNVFRQIGDDGGTVFGSGFLGAIKTPILGPTIVGIIGASIATVMPAAGALAAGGLVAGFGGGLTALGAVFAAKSVVVQNAWKNTLGSMAADLTQISKPFQTTLVSMAGTARKTLAALKPDLADAFATLAPAVTQFGAQLGAALAKLGPALRPMSAAFASVLKSLGPAMQDAMGKITKGLTDIAAGVAADGTALADFTRGLGTTVQEVLGLVKVLNDVNTQFTILTGGTSLVKVTMAGINSLLTPLIVSFQGLSTGIGLLNALTHSTEVSGKSMSDAANHTVQLFQAMRQASPAAGTLGVLVGKTAHETHAANVEAALAAGAYDRQKAATDRLLASLFRLQNLQLALKGSQIGMANAIAAATQSIKDNGKHTALATEKGRANQQALLDVAQAANAQTQAMIQSNKGMVASYAAAAQSRASFVKLAVQMGFSKSAANAMAQSMIAIPNVTRVARLQAQKQDLDAKLAAAKKQLNDPDLTRERKAKLNADIAALQKQLAKAQAQIDGMHGKTVPITYTISGQNFTLNTKTPSRVGGLATGGQVRGPGSGTSDTAGVFALSNNEYVVRAASAQGYGSKAMKSINDGTATVIPGMASGGAVNIHGTGAFRNNAQMQKYLMQNFGGGVGPTGPAGAGVQRWRAVALQALSLAGAPATWIGSLLARMQRESGGNPRAINLWDSNAKAGTPSIGLMQTIGPTFNAFAGALRGRGIYDPLANIYAAIKYTISRYGSGPAGWNKPGGYKQGTPWVPNDQLAFLHKGEAVVPAAVNKRSAGVGGDVAGGMAKGMLGGGSKAVDAAGQVAMQMIAKAKDVLGISSPSKAFAQLGLYINQGFRIGLMGSAKQVQSAMSSLMSKVLNISFNAADTKKSIQKTISSLNTALASARSKLKPIRSGMSRSEVAATERSNRAVSATIRSIQARLASAKVDLANVNAIASRLGTTKKRNAVIGMMNRENMAMQKLANARAVVASQLSAAQTKLAAAIQVRDDFKKQITDAAMSFNSIVNVQPPEGGQLTASGIIAQMTETLRKTQQFAANLAKLKKSGLNATTYQQIAEAGVEQGGAIADALLSGGGNTFNTINRLQSNINSAAAGLGDTAAKNLYQAGVDAAQGLVNGLLAKTKALDAASKKLAAAIVAQIKKTLGIRSPSKVLQWHGAMAGQGFALGVEGELPTVAKAADRMAGMAVPSSRMRRGSAGSDSGGEVITVPVQFILDGKVIQQSLLKLKRTNGGVELGIA